MAGLWVSNEFDLHGPSAIGRPPPAAIRFASAQADARREAPPKADFHRRNRPAPRREGVSKEFDQGRPSADGRPPPAAIRFASAQADAGREAPLEADFNRRRRPTPRREGVSNEFALHRPSADGRPPPAKRHPASAQADAPARSASGGGFPSAHQAGAPARGRVEGIRPGEAFGRWPASAGRNPLRVGAGRRGARSASEGRFQSVPRGGAWQGA
ncbi:hypothetical protein HRbin22_01149 [Candidatus Thermoflexus japonica]|uniref:Uncharacterized protein n=1 Tax=Candidatus Thermoflexus japonica TaxID=2035417 RepID=A0A2H5Y628_9CHLR|nr:hypothetical protein HRbin22_01149 [Candidatus Thermoflexus japonica]